MNNLPRYILIFGITISLFFASVGYVGYYILTKYDRSNRVTIEIMDCDDREIKIMEKNINIRIDRFLKDHKDNSNINYVGVFVYELELEKSRIKCKTLKYYKDE